MPPSVPPSGKGKKLLDQYREALRNRHYSLRTEKTYISWVRQYILYHHKRHPREMGVAEINDFITNLVNQKTVSASTQNQAISAILFLYRNVLHIQLDEKALIPIRPSRAKRVPTALSRDEAMKVIAKDDLHSCASRSARGARRKKPIGPLIFYTYKWSFAVLCEGQFDFR